MQFAKSKTRDGVTKSKMRRCSWREQTRWPGEGVREKYKSTQFPKPKTRRRSLRNMASRRVSRRVRFRESIAMIFVCAKFIRAKSIATISFVRSESRRFCRGSTIAARSISFTRLARFAKSIVTRAAVFQRALSVFRYLTASSRFVLRPAVLFFMKQMTPLSC